MKDIGRHPPEALRKNSPFTGCCHVSWANSRRRSHRGRSAGAGLRSRTLLPRVASMFSPSTMRYVMDSGVPGIGVPLQRAGSTDRSRPGADIREVSRAGVEHTGDCRWFVQVTTDSDRIDASLELAP